MCRENPYILRFKFTHFKTLNQGNAIDSETETPYGVPGSLECAPVFVYTQTLRTTMACILVISINLSSTPDQTSGCHPVLLKI